MLTPLGHAGSMERWSREWFAAQGRRGGKLGGKKSRAALTPAQRSEAARRAAKARWAKRRAT